MLKRDSAAQVTEAVILAAETMRDIGYINAVCRRRAAAPEYEEWLGWCVGRSEPRFERDKRCAALRGAGRTGRWRSSNGLSKTQGLYSMQWTTSYARSSTHPFCRRPQSCPPESAMTRQRPRPSCAVVSGSLQTDPIA